MNTNKKLSIFLSIIFALVIIAGAVCYFVFDVAGVGFTQTHTVTISNKLLRFEDFETFLDTFEENLFDSNIKADRRQTISDTGYTQAVVYDFNGLSQESVQQIENLLDAEKSVIYTVTVLGNSHYCHTISMLAIAAGIIVVVQLAYYWLFARFSGKFVTAVATTVVTIFSLAVSVAVMLILGAVGIKITGLTLVAPVVALFVSVIVNLLIMERLGAKLRSGQSKDVAVANMVKETRPALTLAFLLGLVACVLLAALGGPGALSVSLCCFFSFMATMVGAMYLLLPFWLKISK